MAGDWIKMRTDLYRDPKVCRIAERLADPTGELARFVSRYCQRDMTVTRNVTRNVTVGALVTVWGVTRHQGKRVGDDLVLHGATISVVDDIADLPGFGSAMESVGWLVESDDGLVLPGFFRELNTEPSVDNKVKNAERQRKYREKRNALRNGSSDVTVTSQSNARERVRVRVREENNTLSLGSENSDFRESSKHWCDDRFREKWSAWVLHKLNSNPLSPIAEQAALYKLEDQTTEDALAIVEFSLLKNAKNLILNGDHRAKPDAPKSKSQFRKKVPTFEEVFGK